MQTLWHSALSCASLTLAGLINRETLNHQPPEHGLEAWHAVMYMASYGHLFNPIRCWIRTRLRMHMQLCELLYSYASAGFLIEKILYQSRQMHSTPCLIMTLTTAFCGHVTTCCCCVTPEAKGAGHANPILQPLQTLSEAW